MLCLLSQHAVCAAEKIDAKTWRGVKVYDMAALEKLEPLPMRRIVGVRFDYRDRRIEHIKPNWFYSSIWSNNAPDRVPYIRVMVAKADVPAFEKITTDPSSNANRIVYGQILRDAEADYVFLRLLGTKVSREKKGNVTVSW